MVYVYSLAYKCYESRLRHNSGNQVDEIFKIKSKNLWLLFNTAEILSFFKF